MYYFLGCIHSSSRSTSQARNWYFRLLQLRGENWKTDAYGHVIASEAKQSPTPWGLPRR
jgi:hypothetical protein